MKIKHSWAVLAFAGYIAYAISKKESELLRFRTCNSHFGRDKTFISVQIKFIVRFTGYDEYFIPLRKPNNKPQFIVVFVNFQLVSANSRRMHSTVPNPHKPSAIHISDLSLICYVCLFRCECDLIYKYIV